MESCSSDSATWIKPGLHPSSHSYGVSKALSARLDTIDSRTNSPHLSLLYRLIQVVKKRELPEISLVSGGEQLCIGNGATYQVKRAQVVSGRTRTWVAIKRAKVVVPKKFTTGLSANDEAYRRLQAVLLEIEILSHPRICQHDNIAPLIGYAWDETASGYAPVLVMELATFGDARGFLSSTQLSDEEKLSLCGDIASGLRVLHACSIVHGDMKLENVLIYPGTGRRFLAKISDLERSPQNGDHNLYRGTRIYNAPEVQAHYLSNKSLLKSSTELWLCDAFSFGLLAMEVFSDVKWYGEMTGGDILMEQVLCGTEADYTILHTALGVVEKSLHISLALRTVLREILQHTLSPVSHRLQGGLDTTGEHEISGLSLPPSATDDTQYSILEICSIVKVSKASLGDSMWSEMEWTASHNAHSSRRGKAAFELFMMYGLGKFSADISLHDALNYVTSAAFSGYSPAFIVGKRLFSANGLPIPQVFQQGPQDTGLRQQINSLEELPNDEYYSSAVRIFWSPHIRKIADESMSKFGATYDNQSGIEFMDWLSERQKELDSSIFKKFAIKSFLIHQAVARGCHIAVDFLLQLDLDVNVQTPDGITPLHLACRLADSKMINKLLEYGAIPSLHASDNTVPLHWLVLLDADHIRPVAEALVRAGAATTLVLSSDVFFDDLGLWLGGCPLAWACRCRNHKAVEVLLNLGINPLREHQNTAMAYLQFSLGMLCPSITETLLRYSVIYPRQTLQEKEDIFKLIGMGASSSNFQRWLVHGSAYTAAFGKVIESLSRCHMDLPLEPRKRVGKFSPLARASMSYNIPLAKEFLRLGVNIDERDQETGYTALDTAILSSGLVASPQNTYELVEFLVQCGATTEYVELTQGNTGFQMRHPVFLACCSFQTASLIRLLALVNPSQVNQKCSGETPMHAAAINLDDDALSTIQALVESKADVQIENDHVDSKINCCRTALAGSLFALNWPVAEYLLEHGSTLKFGTLGAHEQSVLHLLIRKGFVLESQNRSGEIACLVSVIKDLLDHPVSQKEDLLNSVDFRGVSPMGMAVFYGLPRLLKIFFKRIYGSCTELDDIRGGRISLSDYWNDTGRKMFADGKTFELEDRLAYFRTPAYQRRLEEVLRLIGSQLGSPNRQLLLPLTSF